MNKCPGHCGCGCVAGDVGDICRECGFEIDECETVDELERCPGL